MKLTRIWEDLQSCPNIKLTKEMVEEVRQFKSDEDLLRGGGLSIETLDRAAHGFCEDDVKVIHPGKLTVKWKEDYENVLWEIEKSGKSAKQWSSNVNLNEPIDVSYNSGKFFIEDGHHRYVAAKTLGKFLNCNLKITENPIRVLTPTLSYDEFHRCLFKQVNNI